MLAVCGIVRRKGRILMCKRPACGMFPGFWELPTESLEENETFEDALERVFFEKTKVIGDNSCHVSFFMFEERHVWCL